MIKVKLFCLITLFFLFIASCTENPSIVSKSKIPEVKIGNQIWMLKNLDVQHFKNGDLILECKTAEEWKKASENKTPAWCYYDFAVFNGKKYGKLYNWYAVNDKRGLAPDGWYVPLKEEWEILINYLGESDASFKLKDKSSWRSNSGSNEVSFSALPGGSQPRDNMECGYIGNYWTNSEHEYFNDIEFPFAYNITLTKEDKVEFGFTNKSYGFSVRCIKGKSKSNFNKSLTSSKDNNSSLKSDFDQDGVFDDDDKCPTYAGPLANSGCPFNKDLDNDGVANEIDYCPREYGIASNNGCPHNSNNSNLNIDFVKTNPNEKGENPFGTRGFGGRGTGGFGPATGPDDNKDGDGTTCSSTPTNLNSIINQLENTVIVTKPTSAIVTIKIKADGSVNSVSISGLSGAQASVERKIKEVISKTTCTPCNGKNKNSRSYTFSKIVLKQD